MVDICKKFAEQPLIPHSRCGRTKAPYKGMKAESWKERFIMKIKRLALFAASVHWADGENILSVLTPRSLTNSNTGMAGPNPSGHSNCTILQRDFLHSYAKSLFYWITGQALAGRVQTQLIKISVLLGSESIIVTISYAGTSACPLLTGKFQGHFKAFRRLGADTVSVLDYSTGLGIGQTRVVCV